MTDEAAMPGNGPLYFVVVFWGEEHREYFLRLCASALLSPRNIPCLDPASGHRFLICAPEADWAAIQNDPDFLALRQAIEVVWLDLPPPPEDSNKYLLMSAGHKMAAEMAYGDGAKGVFLTPDLVLADGAVATIERLAAAGKKVILSVAMRFAHEGAVAELSGMREGCGLPLTVSPRQLAGIALRNMHFETQRYDWDSGFFAEAPYSCFWWAKRKRAIVVHSVSWAPVMVDYSALPEHDTETLENWTMDGDYVYRNFGLDDAIHVIRDTDDLMLASFTHEDDLLGYLTRDDAQNHWYKRLPLVARAWKTSRLRWAVAFGATDPLKKKLLSVPVRFYDCAVSESRWVNTERESLAAIKRALTEPDATESRYVSFVEAARISDRWPFSLLNRAQAAYKPGKSTRLINQSGIDTHRTVLVWRSLSAGRWYWEISSPNLGAAGGEVAETATVGVIDGKHSMRREIGFGGGGGGGGWGWRADGHRVSASQIEAYGDFPPAETAATIMVALDFEGGRIWFGLDGEWFGEGSPDDNALPAFDGLTGPLYPAMSSRHGAGGTVEMQSRISLTEFRYPPPAGFRALR
jgi:hypothetical protein